MGDRHRDVITKNMITQVINLVEETMTQMDSTNRTESRGPNYSWLSAKKNRNSCVKRITKGDIHELESLLNQMEPSDWTVALERLKTSLGEIRKPPTPSEDVPIVFQSILRQILEEKAVTNAMREAIDRRRFRKKRANSLPVFALKDGPCTSFHIS